MNSKIRSIIQYVTSRMLQLTSISFSHTHRVRMPYFYYSFICVGFYVGFFISLFDLIFSLFAYFFMTIQCTCSYDKNHFSKPFVLNAFFIALHSKLHPYQIFPISIINAILNQQTICLFSFSLKMKIIYFDIATLLS